MSRARANDSPLVLNERFYLVAEFDHNGPPQRMVIATYKGLPDATDTGPRRSLFAIYKQAEDARPWWLVQAASANAARVVIRARRMDRGPYPGRAAALAAGRIVDSGGVPT